MKISQITSLFLLFTTLWLNYSCSDFNESENNATKDSFAKKDSLRNISRNTNQEYAARLGANQTLLKYAIFHKIDTLVTKELNYRSHLFAKQKEMDSALYYTKKLLDYAIKKRDTNYIAKAYFKKALYLTKVNKIKEALRPYYLSVAYYKAIKDSTNAGRKSLNLANVQKKLGDFNGSETTATTALQFLDHTNNSKYISGLYHHLTITSKEQKNYKEALYWNRKALHKTTDSLLKIKYQNTRAIINLKNKKYGPAFKILLSLANNPLLKLKANLSTKAIVLDNLAYAKSKLGHPEAEKELLSALQIRKEQNNLSGEFASHIHLTEHYIDSHLEKSALSHAENAYSIAKALKSATAQLEALSYIIDLKSNPKNEAITYRQINDSIAVARDQAKNQFAKLQYDTDKNREENLLLKTQTAEQKLALTRKTMVRNWWIFVAVLLAVLLLFLIWRWKQRIKIAALHATTKTENRISKKVHDELANDISDIITGLENVLPPTNAKREVLLNSLENVYIRTRDIATETGGLFFRESFDQSLKELLMQHHKTGVKVITNIDSIQQIRLDDTKKNAIYRALQELMVNMKKHSQATRVSIVFKKLPHHNEIRYKDNGIGATNIQLNNGLQNAETRMQNIGGSFTFETSKENGFKAVLTFNS